MNSRLQDRLGRFARVVGWTVSGAVSGGALGFGVGISDRGHDEDASPEELHHAQVKILLERAQRLGMLRQALPQLVSQLTHLLTHQQYLAKLDLERMGYYPCSRCGNRHLNAGPDSTCLPMGSYWVEETSEYVAPGDDRWTPEGYQQSVGEPWTGPHPSPELDDDEDDDPPLH